ncbi:MAG: hypothetical protein NXH71_01445 [Erythrobacteraceae bacterium]|nr:hypothetical protein [Erythrobacteraceae bacterium]
MGGIGSGRRATKLDTDGCLRLSLADLRREGALKRNLWARREKGWVDLRSKREVGAVSIVADVDCGRISIKGSAFGQPIDQTLEVVAQPLPFGGERFYVLCPLSGQRCTVLILPPGKALFASVPGWGVAYASTRECEVGRAHRAMRKVEETRLSKYARKPTRERYQQRWMRAFDTVSAWEERLFGRI